jgi:peptide/nickel transport system substrate-binding protein
MTACRILCGGWKADKNLAVKTVSLVIDPAFARNVAKVCQVTRREIRPADWPAGQLSDGLSRTVRLTLALAVALAAAVGVGACRSNQPVPAPGAGAAGGPGTIPRGGTLVASIRAEPKSFSRLFANDTSTDLVSNLTQAKLVRINKVTQEVEPWLAESWTRSPDGLRYTLKLRSEVVFSDGQPLTADDVVATFQTAYDVKSGSVLVDSLQTAGKPLTVAKVDEQTVAITFGAPFAAGLRLLDNLPILPRHKLDGILEAGASANAWSLSTPPAEVVGLGPFVLDQYLPGQRLTFTRNPRYFRKAEDGGTLPYLDRITIEIIPDQNAETLRLEAGQIDMMTSEIAPEGYGALKRAADAGRLKLLDLGVGLTPDSLWFNLKPGALGNDPRSAWLQRDELRRAISLAVDRQAFADTVFLGAGVPVYGPITEANRKWYWAGMPRPPVDLDEARAALAAIGLADRDGDGVAEDASGRPARFTLITQKGRPSVERGSNVIRDELRKIGLVVNVVALDFGAVVERIMSADYEAIYFNAAMSDTDPALTPDFWFSFGSAHFWNMGQKAPATDWERQIDELMARQIAAGDEAERKRLFDDVQRIFAEHQPAIYFVAPRVYVGVSSRVTNVTPAVLRPQLLWSPDTVAVVP